MKRNEFVDFVFTVMKWVTAGVSCVFTVKFFGDLLLLPEGVSYGVGVAMRIGFGVFGLLMADVAAITWLYIRQGSVTTTAQRHISTIMLVASGLVAITTTLLSLADNLTVIQIVTPAVLDYSALFVGGLIVIELVGIFAFGALGRESYANNRLVDAVISETLMIVSAIPANLAKTRKERIDKILNTLGLQMERSIYQNLLTGFVQESDFPEQEQQQVRVQSQQQQRNTPLTAQQPSQPLFQRQPDEQAPFSFANLAGETVRRTVTAPAPPVQESTDAPAFFTRVDGVLKSHKNVGDATAYARQQREKGKTVEILDSEKNVKFTIKPTQTDPN